MKVLFLCGYFESKYQEEILEKTKTVVENAANTFQQRLISGFKSQASDLTIVSAPFLGAWPTAYRDKRFKAFLNGYSEENIQYVPFNNIWGYRNISRAQAMKRKVKEFVQNEKNEEKAIIVYSAHTPFLEAAVYGKSMDPSIHIHLIVPDLPQYMNLSSKKSRLYTFFKKIDMLKMRTLLTQVDSFTLLTDHMAEKLQVGSRPYIVVEGITDKRKFQLIEKKACKKRVAYAGRLVESYGVKNLIQAFELITDPEASLHICGGGELRSYVEEMCKKDARIHYYGIVSAERATEILQDADVLVNPRKNDDEYTKYSFPSKIIEYLMTGNEVVAYMLDGMPREYKDFLHIPKSQTNQSLAEEMIKAWEMPKESKKALDYLIMQRNPVAVTQKILDMCNNKKAVR